MVDFVSITYNAQWPLLAERVWLDDNRLGPHSYFQDVNNVDIVAGKQTTARDTVGERYASKDDARKLALEDSVIWPFSSVKRKDPLPLVASVVAAFFIAPVVDPTVTSGAGIAFGYAVGAVANYFLEKDKPQPAVAGINKLPV